MRPFVILLFFTLFMLGMDLYALRGIQLLAKQSLATGFQYVYWGISVLMFLALLRAGTQFQHLRDPSRFFPVMLIMGIFLMIYLPKLLFNLSQLLGDVTLAVVSLFQKNKEDFRSWFLVPGAILGLLLMAAFAWGLIRGRTNTKIYREDIAIQGLPPSFQGLRIVQLSDIHLAGFYRHPEYIRP